MAACASPSPPAAPIASTRAAAGDRDAAPTTIRADPSATGADHDACRPCTGLIAAGSFAVLFHTTGATKLGHGDRDATMQVYAVDGERLGPPTPESREPESPRGQRCCLLREQSFPPSARLWRVDPARAVAYVRAHDDRWAAFVTEGIWEVDLAATTRRQVIAGIANEFPCPSDNSYLALITREPDPVGQRRDFYAAPFRLMLLEVAPGQPLEPELLHTSADLSRYHVDAGDEMQREAEREFYWSADCRTFHHPKPPR